VLRDDVLSFDPLLPDEIDRLEMRLHYRQHAGLQVEVTRDRLTISSPAAVDALPPIKVAVRGEIVTLERGTTRHFPL
jgi:trehalose/maltose hydrolase-like predicted phosphorylase